MLTEGNIQGRDKGCFAFPEFQQSSELDGIQAAALGSTTGSRIAWNDFLNSAETAESM
jgi:hypothetical protein